MSWFEVFVIVGAIGNTMFLIKDIRDQKPLGFQFAVTMLNWWAAISIMGGKG